MKGANPRNRRVSSTRQRKQQHLLEVTVRRDKAIAQRNRAVFFGVCKVLIAVGVVVGAYLGAREALRRFLWENPDYFVSEIRVLNNYAVTREQIRQASGIAEGQNIFTLDLVAARARIDALPQVERAEIQRVLPNRVDISITERRPIAWLVDKGDVDPKASDKAFLIDARGMVMRSKTVRREYLHMPIISGVEVENLAPGQRVRSFEVQAALDLVRLNAGATRFQARNIDVSKGYCLVVTDQRRAQFTFPLEGIDKKLELLNRLLDQVPPTREIRTVNLLVDRNVPVTFHEDWPPAAGEDSPAPLEPDGPAKAPTPPVFPKSSPAPAKSTPRKTQASSAAKSKKKSTPTSRKTPAGGVRKPFRSQNG